MLNFKGMFVRLLMPLVFIASAFNANAFAFDSVGLMTGFLKADLYKSGESYEAVPLLVSFNYNLGDSARRGNYPAFSFVIEPCVSIVTSPDTNFEAGASLLLQYTGEFSDKIHPYVKAGAGLIWLSQESAQQTDGLNFSTHAGIGVSRSINAGAAVNLEYRFRHVSNGGVKKPNSGIDSGMLLAGIVFKMG